MGVIYVDTAYYYQQMLNYMDDTLKQATIESIDLTAQQFSNRVKAAAKDFLNKVQSGLSELDTLNQLLERQDILIKKIQKGQDLPASSIEYAEVTKERQKYGIKKDYYKKVITAVLDFQEILNEVLKQKVELIYVYVDDDNNPQVYNIPEKDLIPALSYDRDGQYVKGRFKEKYVSAFKALLRRTDLIQQADLPKNFNLTYFNYTFKEVLYRYNKGKKGDEQSLILWLNPYFSSYRSKWLKALVSNTGDIKQAYASIFLNKEINSIKLFNDQKLDNNVHSFMEEVAKVDDNSGLLAGDVTVGNIEYAIKGVKASTLGMAQVVQLAKKIINGPEAKLYTKEDLLKQKSIYQATARTRNTIEEIGLKKITSWKKTLAKQIESKNTQEMKVLVTLT